jgi:hypothetical protein
VRGAEQLRPRRLGAGQGAGQEDALARVHVRAPASVRRRDQVASSDWSGASGEGKDQEM